LRQQKGVTQMTIPNLPQYVIDHCEDVCDYFLGNFSQLIDNFNTFVQTLYDWFLSTSFPNVIFQESDRSWWYIPPGGIQNAQPIPNMPNVFFDQASRLLSYSVGTSVNYIEAETIKNNLFYDSATSQIKRVTETGSEPVLPFVGCVRHNGDSTLSYHDGSAWVVINFVGPKAVVLYNPLTKELKWWQNGTEQPIYLPHRTGEIREASGALERYDGSSWQPYWPTGWVRAESDGTLKRWDGSNWQVI